MSSTLSTELREGTKKAHTMAENMGFVRCFLRGVVEKNSYRKLVANFYYAYAAMEEELERHKDHPVVSTVYFPELHRKASLEADLAYYYGPNWVNEISMTPGGQRYVDRIREVSNSAPELLVSQVKNTAAWLWNDPRASAATRTLDDLAGALHALDHQVAQLPAHPPVFDENRLNLFARPEQHPGWVIGLQGRQEGRLFLEERQPSFGLGVID